MIKNNDFQISTRNIIGVYQIMDKTNTHVSKSKSNHNHQTKTLLIIFFLQLNSLISFTMSPCVFSLIFVLPKQKSISISYFGFSQKSLISLIISSQRLVYLKSNWSLTKLGRFWHTFKSLEKADEEISLLPRVSESSSS